MSLQVMKPVSALQPMQFPLSSDIGPQQQDDGVQAGDSNADASAGGSGLPADVDKLLQDLMKLLTDAGAGASADSGAGAPNAAAGPNSGSQASGGGLDPQTMEMLAYIARMFEARMQQQQQASQPDAGAGAGPVGGAGGGSPAPAVGGDAGGGGVPQNGAAAPAGPTAALPPTQDTTAVPVAGKGGAPGAGLTLNEGGVAQAPAIDGVAPNATKVVDTGTGTDRIINMTNNSDRTKSFEYETAGKEKAVMTLAPHETEAFRAGSKDLAVRTENSDAQGNVHPNEQLFETGGSDNGQAAGVSNDDISNVDGNVGFDGKEEKMTDTLSDGKKAGDGNKIRPYQNPTDDAAAMGLAGDSSLTSNVVVSD